MTNLSFARIMYGTSEDSQGAMNMNASALAAAADPSTNHGRDKAALEIETLGELLHRAWANLSGKA